MGQPTDQKIRVVILEDFQSTIDGYHYRLDNEPEIEIAAVVSYGEELEGVLSANLPIHVLILDIRVPISATDSNPYPILHVIPSLLERYSELHIVVISTYSQATLIKATVDAGVSGYILKDDRDALQRLGAILVSISSGGMFFSKVAHEQLRRKSNTDLHLSQRQTQVLSLCASYPEKTSAEIGRMIGLADATVRNLLSQSYERLGVRSRTAAVAKAKEAHLIAPEDIYPLDSGVV